MIRRRVLSLVFLLLAACAPRPPAQRTPTPTALPPRATEAEASPSPPAATPTPSPTAPPACLTRPGRLEHGEIDHPELPRPLPYRIYLPACAGEPGFERLSSLYLLHGLTYDDSQWDRLGAATAADQLIASGQVRPFLLILPWERTGLDLERAITEALIPEIESRFPASAGRSNRAIGGLSRGAGWALRIGLKHPELFGAIGLHSPAVLSPDLFYLPGWVEAIPKESIPRIALDIGERDPLRPEALALAGELNGLGLVVELTPNPGQHTESYWAEHVAEYLAWYAEAWSADGSWVVPAAPDEADPGLCPCVE